MAKKRIRISNYLILILIAGAGAYSYFHSREVYSWYMRTYYEKIRGIDVGTQIRNAEEMYRTGEYERLSGLLKTLIMTYPDNRELKKLEGRCLIRLGRPSEGADLILTAAGGERMPERLLIETTTALFEKRMYRDITRLFRNNTPGGNAGLLYMHGVALYEAGRFTEAARNLKGAFERGRNGSDASLYLGRAYDMAGETRAALPYLERARRLNREDPDIVMALANAYRKLGRFDDAARTMRAINR